MVKESDDYLIPTVAVDWWATRDAYVNHFLQASTKWTNFLCMDITQLSICYLGNSMSLKDSTPIINMSVVFVFKVSTETRIFVILSIITGL